MQTWWRGLVEVQTKSLDKESGRKGLSGFEVGMAAGDTWTAIEMSRTFRFQGFSSKYFKKEIFEFYSKTGKKRKLRQWVAFFKEKLFGGSISQKQIWNLDKDESNCFKLEQPVDAELHFWAWHVDL